MPSDGQQFGELAQEFSSEPPSILGEGLHLLIVLWGGSKE